jgi:hypothetical protein
MDNSTILRNIEYLLGVLLSIIVADGIISQFLIEEGLGYEGNPFLKTLATDSNFLIIKMCGAIISVLILWNLAKRKPRLVLIFSSIVVFIYTAILFWNISIYIIAVI